jgi:hypothetical protein
MSGGGGGSSLSNISSCGTSEIFLFVFAVFFGTFTSICSKTMMSMSGTNGTYVPMNADDDDDDVTMMGGMMEMEGMVPHIEPFSKPLFQTFGMFVGMLFGLVMHALVVRYGVPFPGYDHGTNRRVSAMIVTTSSSSSAGAVVGDDDAAPNEATSLVIGKNGGNGGNGGGGETSFDDYDYDDASVIPTSMYFLLAIPAVFDLAATALW